MSIDLEIALAPERSDEGTPEERAAFGLFTIRTAAASLTEGYDFYLKGYRPGPLVSGYHAAEWLAWNWWRLRWEPRSNVADWEAAHCMPSIGEGYLWPNLTIFSDGVRVALLSEPSARADAKPFRYVGSLPTIVPASLWEGTVDAYVPQVLGRLREAGIAETNLDRLWADVLAERGDPDAAMRRRLEALLGRDADSVEDDTVDRLLADAGRLGPDAVGEVAANRGQTGPQGRAPVTAAEFESLAREHGHDAAARDFARLADTPLPRGAHIPAWRLGVAAARALRAQERLGDGPIDDGRLAQLAGTRREALTAQGVGGINLSFALDANAAGSRIVLRSRWDTGRRFDLARLIGDRLIDGPGVLQPATRAYTYRQKAQRAFAAEFLSPFDAVDAMLADDYDDEERRQAVAERYRVSVRTVDTLLMNHGRLPRDYDDRDFDAGTAAA